MNVSDLSDNALSDLARSIGVFVDQERILPIGGYYDQPRTFEAQVGDKQGRKAVAYADTPKAARRAALMAYFDDIEWGPRPAVFNPGIPSARNRRNEVGFS